MIRPLTRDIVIAAVVTLVVVAIVSLAPPPGASRLDGQSHDFAHVLVFGVAGLFISRTLRRFPGAISPRLRVVIITLTIGLVFGVLTELAQQYLGGWLSRGDVVRDMLGTSLGICLAFASEAGTHPATRRALVGVAVLGVVVAAVPLASTLLDYRARSASFPVLIDPTIPRSLAFVTANGDDPSVVPLPPGLAYEDAAAATATSTSTVGVARDPSPRTLGIRVALDRGPWPGTTLTEPMPDWRGYRNLVLEIANPGDAPLPLNLRVNDQAHDNRWEDRYNIPFELPPRSIRRLVFPVSDIEAAPKGRHMDLAAIEKIVVFHDNPAARREFYLLRLALER